ncbi:stage II sporulation protein M [Thiocapsa marina]|uniref:Stage II sporulation protein M n=1 Tax=Thiocapsa marina 5811 TaxID=768671 RepID=F9U8P9_9GAMM|nr:stage II sporulation protein M [Thiocapsa marina]EGV19157.1 protein of unknown function DUF95 transmembrane [Thiocapsa marina 5811]
MKQDAFESAASPIWTEYRVMLDALENPRRRRAHIPDLASFPQLHRRLCSDYALARSRRYSPGLIADLEVLVRRGHRQLYRRGSAPLRATLDFMARQFPRTLRRHSAVFWIAAALFFLPMIGMGVAVHQDTDLVYSLLDAEQVADLESLYDPTRHAPGRGSERLADTDVAMFGFYVMNNVGIGFRTFAGGLVLGLGSLVILLVNGLSIGAVAGHLTRLDYGTTFWPFVSGHGPFELTAIAICGAAGLLLGQALLAPGQRTRLAALRANARDAVILVGGAALMLVSAAVIEAFWSAGPAPSGLKYGVGVLGWVLVAVYLALAGRAGDDAH